MQGKRTSLSLTVTLLRGNVYIDTVIFISILYRCISTGKTLSNVLIANLQCITVPALTGEALCSCGNIKFYSKAP